MNENPHDPPVYPFIDTSAWQPPPVVTPSHSPPAKHQPFGRFYLDRQDPVEAAGYRVRDFSGALCYQVGRDLVPNVVADLRETVLNRFHTASVPGACPRVVDYDDARTGRTENSRRYIVVKGETRRATLITVFATFLSNGDYVYVSLDAFVLPPISRWRLFIACVISFFGYSLAGAVGSVYGAFSSAGIRAGGGGGGLLGMAGFGVILAFTYYRQVVRSLVAGDSFPLALRRKFHRWSPPTTFDSDDVLAFLKSSLLLMLYGIQDVFEAYSVPIDVLNRMIQQVNISTNVTNTGNMTVTGTFIAGAGNAVMGTRT